MASDSSSGFSFSFPTRGISHFTTATQNTTEGVEGRTNEQHGLGSAPSEKMDFCDTLHYLCICRLSPACILRETSTKATRNANSSLTVFPHCLLLLTVLPLDCYLTPTGLFCSPLSTASFCLPLSTHTVSSLVSSSSRPLPVSQEISSSSHLFRFHAKADKEIVWPAHTPTQHNGHIVSHIHAYVYKHIYNLKRRRLYSSPK